MTKLAVRSLIVALFLCAASLPACAQEGGSFRIAGAVKKPGEWTVARVTRELAGSVREVRYQLKEEMHVARCVPLAALLDAAELSSDSKRKNPRLAFAAIVHGRDGYAVCFSLGELTPDISASEVWVALEVDGKPLAGKDAPVRLLVPSDKKPARWIFGIESITVVDGAGGGTGK
jgi:hypothetical protein